MFTGKPCAQSQYEGGPAVCRGVADHSQLAPDDARSHQKRKHADTAGLRNVMRNVLCMCYGRLQWRACFSTTLLACRSMDRR